MKKIYRFLQQLEFIGGTETATLTIANSLVNDFDITLIVTGKEPSKVPYFIDSKIKIIYLNKDCYSQLDKKIMEFCSEKSYFKAFLLIIKNINFVLFYKYKLRKHIKSITTKDDILIGSSLDNYLIIPKDRYFIYHYHFNAKFYENFKERFMSIFYRKADKYVFLSKSIKEDVVSKHKLLKNKAFYIENPIKVSSNFNDNLYGNKLLFIGRYCDQKNPLFLIRVMKILKDKDFPFTLDMYGEGALYKKLESEILKNSLDLQVFLHKSEENVEKILVKKDLLLLSSKYEGIPLVINEAASFSTPTFTLNFGKSVYDLVNDKTGVIVEKEDEKLYAEELIKLLNDKDRLIKMKKDAYENAKKYSKTSIKNRWIELILDK